MAREFNSTTKSFLLDQHQEHIFISKLLRSKWSNKIFLIRTVKAHTVCILPQKHNFQGSSYLNSSKQQGYGFKVMWISSGGQNNRTVKNSWNQNYLLTQNLTNLFLCLQGRKLIQHILLGWGFLVVFLSQTLPTSCLPAHWPQHWVTADTRDVFLCRHKRGWRVELPEPQGGDKNPQETPRVPTPAGTSRAQMSGKAHSVTAPHSQQQSFY